MSLKTLLSVILPTQNEEKNGFYRRTLERLSMFKDVEIIVVDGGSRDKTVAIAKSFGLKPIAAQGSNRAQRLNIGASFAKGEMLLLHHPRSLLDVGAINDLLEQEDFLWGGFRHRFDTSHPILQFTSWYSNRVRFRLWKVVYLDHCIFVQTKLLRQIGGVPETDIFEDTLLSRALRKHAKPHMIPYDSTTSSIRFRQNGYLKQVALNQYCKLAFFLRFDLSGVNAKYEARLNLNSDVEGQIPKSVIKRPTKGPPP